MYEAEQPEKAKDDDDDGVCCSSTPERQYAGAVVALSTNIDGK